MASTQPFNTKKALTFISELEGVGRTLKEMPELLPIAHRMLDGMMGNGNGSSNGVHGPIGSPRKRKKIGRPKKVTKSTPLSAVHVEETTRKGKPKSAKGFKYAPGTHWTQKPENRGKLSKVIKKAYRAKAALNA